MKIKSLQAALIALLAAPLTAQTYNISAFGDIRFKDVRSAALPPQGPVETLIAALSGNAGLDDKLKAVAAVTSDQMRQFEWWDGRLDPNTEYQVALSLKNVAEWPAAEMATRFKAVAILGRISRRFRYVPSQDETIATLKNLAFWTTPTDPAYGLGREALLGLADMAKAAPVRGMDPQWPDKVAALSEEILNKYLAGTVSDPIPQEAFAGLAILHNYLEFNLLDNAEGNREGDWQDRVQFLPSMRGDLAFSLQGILLDPVERDSERLYSAQNTYFRGYFVATMVDLGQVQNMDFGVLERIKRLLTTMARHQEPNPKISAMLARYRR